MARTKKAEVTTSEVKDVEQKQNTDMQAILAQMQAMQAQIDKLTKEKEKAVSDKLGADELIVALKKSLEDKKTDDVDAEQDVPVMSGCMGLLILSTDGMGQQTKYRFEEMGEVHDIPYADLKEICKNMRNFAQQGLFYILDDKIVKKLRLGGYYNKMASQDDIIHFFERKPSEMIGIYSMASDDQKEVITQMVLDRKSKGESVDYNLLAEISKQSGKNLLTTED
jgi:hypothetical protein